MTNRLTNRDDILGAFAVEPVMDRATLERYIRDYPEQAAALIDLAHERDVIAQAHDVALTAQDEALINAAWLKHASIVPAAANNTLRSLTVDKQRELASALTVPRQVITVFRDGKILLDSVPRKFLQRFARTLGEPFDDLMVSLTAPRLAIAKSFKADDKPQETGQVTFEQVLIEAGVDPDTRARLLDDVT
jgi:hypothetical protein